MVDDNSVITMTVVAYRGQVTKKGLCLKRKQLLKLAKRIRTDPKVVRAYVSDSGMLWVMFWIERGRPIQYRFEPPKGEK